MLAMLADARAGLGLGVWAEGHTSRGRHRPASPLARLYISSDR